MIDFSCENCGAAFRAAEQKAGKKAKCPKCGAAIRIPPPAAEPGVPVDSSGAPVGAQWPESTPQQRSPARRHATRPRPKPRQPLVAWVLVGLAALVVAGVVIGLSTRSGRPDESQQVATAPQPAGSTEPVGRIGPSPAPQPEPEPQIEPIYGLPGQATEHYVFYTHASPEGQADIAMRLEHIYAEYSRDMADVLTPSNGKAKVFFIADEQAYATAGGEALGTFRSDNDAPRLLMLHSGDKMYLETTQLVQHEGWHQFNFKHVRKNCPIWLDEGLATYYGYAIWTGDLTIYGGINNTVLARQLLPSAPAFRPVGELMSLDDQNWRLWQSQDGVGFWPPYMQSWSIIHFLKHADGGTHSHLLDAYIADVAAGADTAAAADAIIALQGQWMQWLQSIHDTSTHGRFFEAIAAALTSHLARAHLNGQTFESIDDFLAAAGNRELRLGEIGSATWLPASIMDEIQRYIRIFGNGYADNGLGTMELLLEDVDGMPAARVRISDCNIDIRATAKPAGGGIDVKIVHLQPLPQRFD